MTARLDLTGQKFGKLVVISISDKKANKKSHWNCLCECGNTKIIVGGDLRSGRTTSCGCYNVTSARDRNFIDLTGQIFKKLTVIGFSKNEKNKNYWHCKCQCGQIIECNTGNLQSGNSYSCGCYYTEECLRQDKLKYIGKKFLKLTVIDFYGYDKQKNKRWLCKCDCGALVAQQTSRLGVIYSCGCLLSGAEEDIAKYLTERKIPFEKQKRFDGCKHKKKLPFDFYINNKFLVEYQGQQHYVPVTYFGGQRAFNNLQKRDAIKAKFCKDQNIPLLVIKYDQNPIQELENFMEHSK